MAKRRTKGDGGLIQRHDHETCPPLIEAGIDPSGRPVRERPPHSCRGRWVGTIDVIDPTTGKKRRKSVYGRTQKQAAARLKEAIHERDRGELVMSSPTVETWMTEWLTRQQRRLKPQTARGYESKIRIYIVPHLGRYRLTALRASHIEAMYDAMRRAGLTEATLRQTHAILKKALSDAIKRDKLAVSPMAKIEEAPATTKNQRAQFNTAQARQVLLAAADDPRWWLALFYGMRQGECLGLDWSTVDLEQHHLTITQTLQTGLDGRLVLGSPKSRASHRTLPLVPVMEARLRVLWESEGRPTSGLLFHRDGHPIQPKADWNAWRDLIDRATVIPCAPLPYIALHAARNSAASLMEASGIPDRLVMQIFGQSQVQTTHGYQAADLARMAQAFAAVGNILELE